MNQAPNLIPEVEYVIRMGLFFTKFPETYNKIDDKENELHKLHNDRIFPKETNKTCSSCLNRAYAKLKELFETSNIEPVQQISLLDKIKMIRNNNGK